jgi:4-hydroxy-tetrahydrodipicolinate synthase
MSLTRAVAESLRQALATVVVVPVTPLDADGNPDWVAYHAAIANKVPDLGIVLYIRNERITGANIAALADRAPNVIGVKYGIRADVRPPSRLLPDPVKQEIRAMLTSWGLA